MSFRSRRFSSSVVSLSLGLMASVAGCDRANADTRAAAPKTDAAVKADESPKREAVAKSLAEGKLAGLYIRQQMVPLLFNGRMTYNLQRDFYYFFPDGHVVFAVPADGKLKERPTAEDFAAFKDVAAAERGTYSIKNGQITFKPDSGSASTEPFSLRKPDDDGELQIGEASVVPSVKALPFKKGAKLDGAYQFDGTIGLGGANTIYNVKTLTFKPDGTLGSDQLSGVDTQGIQTKAGGSGVTTHSNTNAAGKYQFDGYTLETTVGDKKEKATTFRWAGADEAKPGMICIAGRVYSRQESK